MCGSLYIRKKQKTGAAPVASVSIDGGSLQLIHAQIQNPQPDWWQAIAQSFGNGNKKGAPESAF